MYSIEENKNVVDGQISVSIHFETGHEEIIQRFLFNEGTSTQLTVYPDSVLMQNYNIFQIVNFTVLILQPIIRRDRLGREWRSVIWCGEMSQK